MVWGLETVHVFECPRECKSTKTCECLKANALIHILFLLKLNQRILESPSYSVVVQSSTREKIQKWVTKREKRKTEQEKQSETETGIIIAPVVLVSLLTVAKLLTETESTRCSILDAAIP